MFKRVRAPEEERGASLARRFKQSVFWTSLKAAGPIRASVRGGAPPARLLLQGIFHAMRKTFTHVLNSYQVYTL